MGLAFGRLPPPAWTYPDARAYRVHMPHDTTVKAACEDVGCDQWRTGWETVLDESTEMGALTAAWIRSGQCGRTFREFPPGWRNGQQVSIFRFDSGQRCFAEHRTRPGRLLVYSRGRGIAEHTSLRFLAEDYTEHAGRLAGQQERG
jgi:hypothetical protein